MTKSVTAPLVLCDPADSVVDALDVVLGGPVSGEARCEYYRTVCHLPADLDPANGQITLRAGRVQAVMMPSALGERVRVELGRLDSGGGPIVSHPRTDSWTFLTSHSSELDLFTDGRRLWLARVVVLTDGPVIGLPSPSAANPDAHREWVLPPHSPLRPSTAVVLDAARACVKAGERR
ncbi:DNA-directed RNA polymerase subunit beta [Nocardia sp. NPDC060259]|uniref:DNA-directed RNA polymerase subunit beta n=1 Tax=Nocardia sp. NPDC060259 TaxID=3347088 RepID=UPI00365E12D2